MKLKLNAKLHLLQILESNRQLSRFLLTKVTTLLLLLNSLSTITPKLMNVLLMVLDCYLKTALIMKLFSAFKPETLKVKTENQEMINSL